MPSTATAPRKISDTSSGSRPRYPTGNHSRKGRHAEDLRGLNSVCADRAARSTEASGVKVFSLAPPGTCSSSFAAHLSGRSISPADLARAVESPLSTATRWLSALGDSGLATSDDNGQSDVGAKLTREGAAKLQSPANRWASAFVSN
jgi:hypothetical protein